MLELAREDPDHPYLGSAAAFYDYVRPLRRARMRVPATVAVRFEGLPGEFLQIDWGEVRQFPFTHPDRVGQTRYFFAARLKYSRWMFVRFTTDMREETLLRCLIACFVELGGVPWVVTSDNMKTITLGRDAQHQPVWHPTFQKFAVEFGFHPEVCAPAAGNQKGAVESLVKFVKGNFLAGRTFYDDHDLTHECDAWLQRVNTERSSDATHQPPQALLAEEQAAFGPLPAVATDYGLFDSVVVNRESMVTLATNRYSVPAHFVGMALTARVYPRRIELYYGTERVATHERHFGRHARIVIPEHFEAVFALKPRARVMIYRDWLVQLSPIVADYLGILCRKRYQELDAQILALYTLAQEVGRDEFVTAVELASEQQAVGAEYVRTIVLQPITRPPRSLSTEAVPRQLVALPTQQEVERDLAHYEHYIANRHSTREEPAGGAA
jgi:transposase